MSLGSIGIVFLLFAPQLIRVFTTDPEVARYGVLGQAGLPVPKLRALCGADPGCDDAPVSGRNGVFFELLAGLPSFVFIGGEFVDYDGGLDDGTLRLSLEVPALEYVKFSAFYYRVGIGGSNDLFKLDDRSAIVAAASIPIYYIFSLNLRWWRVWQSDPTTGEFASVDDWSAGVGFSIPL